MSVWTHAEPFELSIPFPSVPAAAMGAPFVVAAEESLNRFEAPFVDEHTGAHYTVSFFLREPVLYHPAHLAKPSFTHVQTTRVVQGGTLSRGTGPHW